jgi:hypothetical protein
MECRSGCGACCVAPSISSPIPGLPHGKPAGLRCPHLTADRRCALYDDPARPRVCASFPARPDHCGVSREEALALLTALEVATR